MRSIEQEFTVSCRYPVHFTNGLFDAGNSLLSDVMAQAGARLPGKALFVVDRNLCLLWPELVSQIERLGQDRREVMRLAQPPLIVPGGEAVKNDPRFTELVQAAVHTAGICRHSYVVAIGGGAVLDVAGYAAATAHRGVRLIRVPTTVLSQSDSGVGVKNGINAFGKKNFLGAFSPPYAVLNDSRFLTTLSERDWRSGVSEAVKVALIKDAAFFNFIEVNVRALIERDLAVMEELIFRCARLHVEHISSMGDPFERGSSRPLDFGHWAAHKLEQLTAYEMRHGEAVAIGIALDSTYSYLKGYLSKAEWARVICVLSAIGLDTFAPELNHRVQDRHDPICIFHGLSEFREHLGGELTITLLRSIGHGFEVHSIAEDAMEESICLLQSLHGRPIISTQYAPNGNGVHFPDRQGSLKWAATPAPAP